MNMQRRNFAVLRRQDEPAEQKFTRHVIDGANVVQFDMLAEYVLSPWGLMLRSSGWTFSQAGMAAALGLDAHLPPVQVKANPIKVRLLNVGRFFHNVRIIRFGFRQGWAPLGPRECVGIANCMPSLARDLDLGIMNIVSPLQAYTDVYGRERALEVLLMANHGRLVDAPLLHYGCAADRWLPFAPAEDMEAVEKLAFPTQKLPQAEIVRLTDRLQVA